MNALLNTEEENTNALLFNHEMIKISISTELNAWINIHEADDFIVFIKYICCWEIEYRCNIESHIKATKKANNEHVQWSC